MPSVLSAVHFHSEEAAYRFVEARLWANGRPCPHCGVIDKIGPLKGKSTRIGLYKCYACRKPFTVKVGTIFEASHIKLHVWLQAMHLLCSSKKGMTSNQLHRILGVTLQDRMVLVAPHPRGNDRSRYWMPLARSAAKESSSRLTRLSLAAEPGTAPTRHLPLRKPSLLWLNAKAASVPIMSPK